MGTENLQTNSFTNNQSDVTNNVVKIPVTIDDNVIDGAKEILKVIRPSWIPDNIKFKLFTDGITNKLVGCFYPTTITSNCLTQQTTDTSSADDVVLVRVYGNKTDLLIDRKAERRNIQLLHTYGFAPSLYAVFKNGLAYEYVDGVTLIPETVKESKVWILVAKRLAEMHKVSCGNDLPKVAGLRKKTDKFLDLLPQKFDCLNVQERYMKSVLSKTKLKDEFNNLYEKLEKLNSPVVFAHNDLLLGNVIYTENLNRVTFIDYEYAEYNFQGFDIGNHFTEFAGIDEIDYSRYPNMEFQKKWLQVYLETYNSPEAVTSKDVERLYSHVNKFALASHLFWTIWALIQAQHSTIEFDFIKFAETRFNEYTAKKDEFLALE